MSTPEEREVLARVERRRAAAKAGRASAAKRKASSEKAAEPSTPEPVELVAPVVMSPENAAFDSIRARAPTVGPDAEKEQAAIDAGIARIRALDPKDCLACQSKGGCWIHESIETATTEPEAPEQTHDGICQACKAKGRSCDCEVVSFHRRSGRVIF
jgi:hypothetical protein